MSDADIMHGLEQARRTVEIHYRERAVKASVDKAHPDTIRLLWDEMGAEIGAIDRALDVVRARPR